MPMQPKPIADTSKPWLPSLRVVNMLILLCRQYSVSGGRCKLYPLLHGRPEPLVIGIVDQPLRHRIAVRYQALQHHGQIHVGN